MKAHSWLQSSPVQIVCSLQTSMVGLLLGKGRWRYNWSPLNNIQILSERFKSKGKWNFNKYQYFLLSYTKLHFREKNLLPLSGLSFSALTLQKGEEEVLIIGSTSLLLRSPQPFLPQGFSCLGITGSLLQRWFPRVHQTNWICLLGVVWSGFERLYNLNKLSRWHFPHNKVWEQLQVCLFIVSLWSLFLTSGSQTWLHVRTTWEALKKYWCQNPTHGDPEITGLGLS